MNKHTSFSLATRPLKRLPAFCLAIGLSFGAMAGHGFAAADTSQDISTSRGTRLKWSPAGYWASAPGVLKGSDDQIRAAVADLNANERGRGRIPAGYSFSAGTQREIILSSSSKARPVLPPQPMTASKSSSPEAADTGSSGKLKYENLSPTSTQAVPQPYVNRPVVKGKPVPIPPLPEERRIAAADRPSAPKALPYEPKAAPAAEPAAAVAKTPAARPGPKLIADAPPTAPLALPAPKPAIAAPAGGEVNGIPEDMQKSFLSRNKSVFMIFDKDKGLWTSSPGALKDEASADEWCKHATEVDRAYGRIPATFTYHHLGGGQVQIRKE